MQKNCAMDPNSNINYHRKIPPGFASEMSQSKNVCKKFARLQAYRLRSFFGQCSDPLKKFIIPISIDISIKKHHILATYFFIFFNCSKFQKKKKKIPTVEVSSNFF
jgi:hypothetical protein